MDRVTRRFAGHESHVEQLLALVRSGQADPREVADELHQLGVQAIRLAKKALRAARQLRQK